MPIILLLCLRGHQHHHIGKGPSVLRLFSLIIQQAVAGRMGRKVEVCGRLWTHTHTRQIARGRWGGRQSPPQCVYVLCVRHIEFNASLGFRSKLSLINYDWLCCHFIHLHGAEGGSDNSTFGDDNNELDKSSGRRSRSRVCNSMDPRR